jgi:hypothetical protein
MLRSARTPWPLGENAAMEPIEAQWRSRSNGLCECLLVALALYSLAPRDASAGDQPQSSDARRSTDAQKPARAQIAALSFPAPFAFSAPGVETQVFSPTEFRPRKQSLEAADTGSEDAVIDAPMPRDSSIAGELSEARTQDRVRLLTLWQSRASSLSLQAGRHGAPSLQWSTPWMHRDAASRGLFDRLLAVSPRSLGSTVRSGAPRQPGAVPSKPLNLSTPIDSK